MNKLLLIDGSSLLSTSFFGNLPATYFKARTEEEKAQALKKVLKTSTGIFTNGVFTMTKALLNLIEKQEPTHIVVAWDVSRNTFRRKAYEGYKANRGVTAPELSAQFGVMQELLAAMKIPQFMFEEYEADDIIGTFAKQFEQEIPTYILTKDQDALQLVSEYTRLWLMTSKAKEMYTELQIETKTLKIPDNVFEYTPLYVEEFYGVTPIQIIDKKALEGDSSDNIPGVKGVGPKAVGPLLNEFGTVEEIYEYIENTSEKEAKEFFKELGIRSPLAALLKEDDHELVGKQAAFLSKQLATINTQIEELSEVQLTDLVLKVDYEAMLLKFRELEFKSLVEQMEKKLSA